MHCLPIGPQARITCAIGPRRRADAAGSAVPPSPCSPSPSPPAYFQVLQQGCLFAIRPKVGQTALDPENMRALIMPSLSRHPGRHSHVESRS